MQSLPCSPGAGSVLESHGPCRHVHLALTFQSQEIQWLLSLLLRFPGRLDEAGESVSRPGALGLFLSLILQLAAGPANA